jgi:hypothetical protein
MRQKNISILLAVPVTNALSLANFQSITSVLIPLDCQLTYDSQIPTCTVSDFNDGCSTACVAGLNTIASSVSSSCSHVKVKSNTLLGIVKNGGIVAALCPTLAKTTQATTSVTVQTSEPAVPPAAVSVTIPTGGAGVTGGLGFKTTSTSKPIPVPQSEISTSTTKVVKTTKTSTTTSQSVQSAAGGLGGGSQTTTSHTTTATKTTSTASAETTSSAQSQDKSGGGSPFDVQSNNAPRDVGRSMLALVVAMFAVVVIGR